jgi:hypothetical protein
MGGDRRRRRSRRRGQRPVLPGVQLAVAGRGIRPVAPPVGGGRTQRAAGNRFSVGLRRHGPTMACGAVKTLWRPVTAAAYPLRPGLGDDGRRHRHDPHDSCPSSHHRPPRLPVKTSTRAGAGEVGAPRIGGRRGSTGRRGHRAGRGMTQPALDGGGMIRVHQDRHVERRVV